MIVIQKEKIFVYSIYFLRQGSAYFKVKGIALKRQYNFNDLIQRIDLDFEENYLVVQKQKQLNQLEFYKLSELDDQFQITLLKPLFSLKYESDINDFFFQKELQLDELNQKNFLIIYLKENFFIYSENSKKIFTKIFSLSDQNFTSEATKFKFLVNDKFFDNHDHCYIKGVLFLMKNNFVNVYLISNLFFEKQSLLEDQYCIQLNNFQAEQILSIHLKQFNSIKIITYSKNFIFMKYKLYQENNQFYSKFSSFRLINNSVETDKIIYNHKYKYIYGRLRVENQIFQELKNYYDEQFYFKLLQTDEKDIFLDSFTALINQTTFVTIQLNSKQLNIYQIFENQDHATLKEQYDMSLLKDYFIKQIKFVLMRKDLFYVLIKTQQQIIIIEVTLEGYKVKNIEQKFNLDLKQISESEIEYFELIPQQEKELNYRLFLSNQKQEVITIDLKNQDKDLTKNQIYFEFKILEIYKNHKYPYNYIILTTNNILHFYTNSLEYQCHYDLSFMGLNLNNNPNNFNFKYLYNNFYIFYCFSKIYVGQLIYKFQENKFKFELIDFHPFYLKELNYELNWNSNLRDKIVYFNHKNICIRNHKKLVYGDLNLQPLEENAIQDEPKINIHKYLLLNNFNFSILDENSVVDCLILGKKYYLYYFLFQFVQKDNKKFQFDPEYIYQTLLMDKKEFQEKTEFNNDQQLVSFLENTDFSNLNENKQKFLQESIQIIQDLEQKSQTLDIPSKILYLLHKYNSRQKQFTSEMIIMAICSDQQDFLFQNFFPNSNPLKPPSWQELKDKCVVYWYEDIQSLKRMIDKSAMINYKQNKKIFDIILWFVLLGKVKLLVPLFKLEPNQQKFVIFFGSNFNDEKIIEQTINNAYILKSQKKLELCIAFFILAKQYAEAMTISLEYMKDPQLTILIYRIYFQQIQMQEKQQTEIQKLLENYFFKKAKILNENFLIAIYYHLIQQPDKFLESLVQVKKTKKFQYFENQAENFDFGFTLCNYSTNLIELFNFLKKNSIYKRYFEEQTKEEEDVETLKLMWKNFFYYYLQEKLYQSLVCLIEIKLLDENTFKEKIEKHKKLFEEIFIKICLKRLKNVIKTKQYWRLRIIDEENQKVVNYFNADYIKIQKGIQRRINLLNDFELSLFNDLTQKDYTQAQNYFKKLQKKILKLNSKMLKRDIFKYESNHSWIEKINFVEKFIEMLNNLFISSDEFYLDMFRKHKDDFSDLIIFWLFLISLHTNCWEEAIEILENYKIFDILSENFTNILKSLKEKILKKFNFIKKSPIKDTQNIEFNYSNVNVLVFLFLKTLYFDSFIQKRNKKEEQSILSNLISLQLGKTLKDFLLELQTQFFQLLKSFTFEEQKMIYDEFYNLFNSNLATIQRLNFFILTPLEALDLENNKKFNTDCLAKKKWFSEIEDFIYLHLLNENYVCESKEKIEIKSKLFKKGIEIFKLKPEQTTMNFFSTGLISKILIIENNQYPEIFILVNKRIRKVYLYNSIFKEDRLNDGYQLKNFDNLNSISMVSENIVQLSDDFLNQKPFMSRILYKLFFIKNEIQNDNHTKKIFEKIIDTKIQKREDFNNISIIAKHSELPIMFIVQNDKIFIISNKTLAILCHYSNPSIKQIKNILPDQKGFRILIIDNYYNAYILKFDISFNQITLVHEIKGKQIYYGNWNEDSTKVYFTTTSQIMQIFDLIEITFIEHQIDDHNFPKSHIYYAKQIDQVILINKKNQAIALCDKQNLQILDSAQIRQSEKITCYAISEKKEIIVLGHQNGEIRVLNLRSLEEVDLKVYEDSEKRRLRINNIAFIKDFLICSFSNDTLSIIDKI